MICTGNLYTYIKGIVLSTDMVNKQINQLAKKKNIKDPSLRENIQIPTAANYVQLSRVNLS